jgi:putative flippase GtrA
MRRFRAGTPPLAKQFLSFVSVGVVSTFVTIGVLIVCVEFFGLEAVKASILGYILGGVINYTLNYRYTFLSTGRHWVSAPRFGLVTVMGLLLNALIMHAGVNWLEIHYLLTQIMAVVIILVFSFSANRLWTFIN